MARAALPMAIALLVAFALGAAAGFVFAHDPAREAVVVRVEGEPPVGGESGEAVVGGEVASLEGSRLVVETDRGQLEVELAAVAIEELARVDARGLEVGETVNLGGEQTPFGLALSGVVAIEGATP
jgi:hypothetical protein